MKSQLFDIRREYKKGRLTPGNLNDNPFEQFDHWLNDAIHSDEYEPTAMTVATDTETAPAPQPGHAGEHVLKYPHRADRGAVDAAEHKREREPRQYAGNRPGQGQRENLNMRHPVEVDGQFGAERGEERCCQCEHGKGHRHAEAAEIPFGK